MFPCINQATVLTTDTLKFLQAAKRHSFSYVEFDIAKVEECIAKNGIRPLKQILKENGIDVVSLNAIENYPIRSNEDLEGSVQKCKRIFELCNLLECEIAVVNPSDAEPAERSIMLERFDRFMNEIIKMAKRFNVRLGFEYVSYDSRIINSLAKSIEYVDKWGDGVGLVLDLFHMYRSGESIELLPSRLMDSLYAFHVNDAPAKTIVDLRDSDRLFPLEGVINSRASIAMLRDKKFIGPVSVELFNEKYWSMDTDLVIAKAKSSLETLGVM
ncbi:MAG: sugar phosphate isomerase/epimerase family protein [Candidatus Bathyarchaeia archaeon]